MWQMFKIWVEFLILIWQILLAKSIYFYRKSSGLGFPHLILVAKSPIWELGDKLFSCYWLLSVGFRRKTCNHLQHLDQFPRISMCWTPLHSQTKLTPCPELCWQHRLASVTTRIPPVPWTVVHICIPGWNEHNARTGCNSLPPQHLIGKLAHSRDFKSVNGWTKCSDI